MLVRRGPMSATVKDELTFGSELYRLRNRAGMTQARVADSAGITRGYYSQLENSRRPPPPLEKVRRIAESMELTPSDLRLLWGVAAIERINAPGGDPEQVQHGPTGLYVVWDGLAIDVPKEEQDEIIALLRRKNIM